MRLPLPAAQQLLDMGPHAHRGGDVAALEGTGPAGRGALQVTAAVTVSVHRPVT